MSDWLHNLPVVWMTLVVFGFTYLVAAAIYALVNVLAVGERARSFKVISPGLLPPLGIIFALFVAFTASQVWTDTEKAKAEIDREASALRTVVILATTFPTDSESQLRGLIRCYIADAATQEWAMMANRTANLRAIPASDPVGMGLVDSLARPGGNATGFMSFEYTLSGKWLELLKEIAPGVTRVAVLQDPTQGGG